MQKLSVAGIVSKTNEGSMQIYGNNFAAEAFHFTVDKKELIAAVNDAIINGYKVKVTYVKGIFCNPFLSDSSCDFIEPIKRLEKKAVVVTENIKSDKVNAANPSKSFPMKTCIKDKDGTLKCRDVTRITIKESFVISCLEDGGTSKSCIQQNEAQELLDCLRKGKTLSDYGH